MCNNNKLTGTSEDEVAVKHLKEIDKAFCATNSCAAFRLILPNMVILIFETAVVNWQRGVRVPLGKSCPLVIFRGNITMAEINLKDDAISLNQIYSTGSTVRNVECTERVIAESISSEMIQELQM